MKKIILALSLIIPLNSVLAEDLKTILTRVESLVKDKNYPKALEELGWARKEIEKLNSGVMATLLPDELAGLKGGKTQTNNVMGMTAIERDYTSSDTEVKVSLTTGSPGGGADSLGGGLAALGQMAAMFGQQAGQDVFRIDGMTASMNTEGGIPELTVFLNGGMLRFEMNRGTDTAKLKEMAEKIGVANLDKQIKGQG